MSMGRDLKTTYVVKMTPERIREMKATFRDCDVDNSGDVSRAEFIDGIQNAGNPALYLIRPLCMTMLPVFPFHVV